MSMSAALSLATEPSTSTGPSAFWYLTRGSGAVTLLLLSATLVLGIVDVRRLSSPRWPRFVIDSLHRNVSLLAVLFLGVHILTTVLDNFTSISLMDAVVPFGASYRPFWLGLGALAFDLLIAVTLTSVLRRRLGHAVWRTTHWLAYGCWPIAVLHGLGTGSDLKTTWLASINALCLVTVVAAVVVRLLTRKPLVEHERKRAPGAPGTPGLSSGVGHGA